MIRRNVTTFGAAVLLLGAAACEDGKTTKDAGHQHESDAEIEVDGGDGTNELDASTGGDGDVPDASDGSDGGMDASDDGDVEIDAEVQTDAALDDAGSDQEDAQTGDAATENPSPALAAQYTFDENTGAVAADSAGEFAGAVLENGAGFTAGVEGSALALAGGVSEQFVSLPANILAGCDDVTIALWMKLGSLAPWSRILDIDGTVDGFLFFTATQDVGGAPHLFFNIYHPPGEGPDDQGVSAAYPAGTTLLNEWHHVAFTLSGGTGRLYFDGAEIGSNPMSTKPASLTLGPSAHAWIGRSTFATDPYLEAAIDDLRVSCTAYSAEQMAQLVP